MTQSRNLPNHHSSTLVQLQPSSSQELSLPSAQVTTMCMAKDDISMTSTTTIGSQQHKSGPAAQQPINTSSQERSHLIQATPTPELNRSHKTMKSSSFRSTSGNSCARSQEQLQEQLQEALREEQWKQVEALCEDHPSLARQAISMVCQGENSTCLPIHFAAGQKSTPVSTIDALVTAHPSSLLAVESSGLRLALHLAVLKGASFAVVRYLCEALPQSMGLKDQEGNLPLHYAAMYCNDAIIQLMVKSYPQACREVNRSDRLPLHLLCARCWDRDAISIQTIEIVLSHNPQALQCADRSGRLPLHVCCSSRTSPRADVLQILMEGYPAALLETDKTKATPEELALKFYSTGDLTSLREGTNRERRKKYKFLAPFKHVHNKIARRRRYTRADVDALHLHYG